MLQSKVDDFRSKNNEPFTSHISPNSQFLILNYSLFIIDLRYGSCLTNHHSNNKKASLIAQRGLFAIVYKTYLVTTKRFVALYPGASTLTMYTPLCTSLKSI
jgi:hypothetical protein